MRATDKPFNIDKKLVYEAYKAVKSNAGAAGVDGQTIEEFEADLKSNLYKIWNRMSSGTAAQYRSSPLVHRYTGSAFSCGVTDIAQTLPLSSELGSLGA